MAHGNNNISKIYGELVSNLSDSPVTSAEQVWDYTKIDSQMYSSHKVF